MRSPGFAPRTARWVVALLLLTVAGQARSQGSASPSSAPPAPPSYTTVTAVEYMRGAHGPLAADVYIPKGEGPFPGILFIHGGGWVDGDRNQMIKLIKEFANRGYVGFTIDYDVDPVHYPASFVESLAALRFFRAHAAEYHLDASRVAVAGSSAGGELAALVALNPGGVTAPVTSGQPVATAGVQAAIILNGVLDLSALGDASGMVTKYLGGACSTLAAACKDASPQAHVHAGAPPFFVGHGTADQSVPYAQAVAFVTALRAAKVPVRFFTATGGPHTYWGKGEFYAKNVEDIDSFLKAALHAPATSGRVKTP